LHVHTEYSLLDGAARIGELVKQAKKLKMSALAITDHGSMFGVIDFYKACKKEEIKPILGCEVYTAARRMEDKDTEKDKYQGHLVLLAENMTGYKNLMKIVSAGYTRGFYYKPRVDKELLRKHSEGLIALSACLKGDIERMLVVGDYEGAKKEALALQDIFGEGNFFLELQDQGIEDEARVLPYMERIHEETGIPFAATNDVHYVRQDQATAQDILLCIQTLSTVDDADRMSFANDQFYLKSEKEMREVFANHPEACDNTQTVADRCNVELDFKTSHLPEFSAPDGKTNTVYLRELCEAGFAERYGEEKEQHRERLEYEFSTIQEMGFVEYFLIVWDFIRYAREHGIFVGPGRGSAAGSIVSYILHITDIDPIEYDLIFERFLNPERVSMPDIDIDFCIERRGEVIDYVIDKYGEDRVAQIITFGTLKPKAAVRDVGRSLGMSYGETDRIAKIIPYGPNVALADALKIPEMKKAVSEDPRIEKLMKICGDLEGIARNAGTHAAGVVIGPDRLDEFVPLYKTDKGEVSITTQFTKDTVEELGLLKMDFLGLRNLTVIRDALEMIEANHGVHVDFSKMKYDDQRVFDLIGNGNTAGVFQLESAGMTGLVKRLRPSNVEDITAVIALYRPGPMQFIDEYVDNKKHPDKIRYKHPKLEPILSVTYGVMVYQEQVMEIVRELAGYSYGRSDLVRRAMSKKKEEVMRKERDRFINGLADPDASKAVPGCVAGGVPADVANEIFDQMLRFAAYAFNKSHAAAYAVVAYQTAWLKTHYPAEFMAALMTSVMGKDIAQVGVFVRNAEEMGIAVLPPDILESDKKFTAGKGDGQTARGKDTAQKDDGQTAQGKDTAQKDDGQSAQGKGAIRYGLLGIKNVGSGAVESIIAARKEAVAAGHPWQSLSDVIKSVDLNAVNKKAMESLITAGAFDRFNTNRAQYMAIYEMLMDRVKRERDSVPDGQTSMFGSPVAAEALQAAEIDIKPPEVNDFSNQEKMNMEKEILGIYLSGHPLDEYRGVIEHIANDEGTYVTGKAFVEAGSYGSASAAGGAADEEAEITDAAALGGLRDKMPICFVGVISGKQTNFTKKGDLYARARVEDRYGSAEILVWPEPLEKANGAVENDSVVVLRGKVQLREEAAPTILVNKVTPIDVAERWYASRQ
jgi:DNA polymerase-3 subunit alpha